MKNQTLRSKIEQLFGLPAMKMPWTLYLAQLNEAGKLTARSTMDILTVVLTSMEELEEKINGMQAEIKAKPLELPQEPKVEIGYTTPPLTNELPKVEVKPQELPQELKSPVV